MNDNEPIKQPGEQKEITEQEKDLAKRVELDKIKAQQEKDLKDFKEKEKDTASETVNVNRAALTAMQKRLERLEASADLSRLGKFDAKQQKEIVRVVMLTTWEGKVVVDWKMLQNDVQKINGIWKEIQLVQFILEDSTTIEIPYLRSVQEVVKVDAEILSRTQETNGCETMKVRRKDNGKEYSIDSKFVN